MQIPSLTLGPTMMSTFYLDYCRHKISIEEGVSFYVEIRPQYFFMFVYFKLSLVRSNSVRPYPNPFSNPVGQS